MSALVHQTKLLLGIRLRALRNRVIRLPAKRRRRLALYVVGFVGLMLGLGQASAPTLLSTPTTAATGGTLSGRPLPAGTLALEAAFWLSVLASSVTTFRAMELLFRRGDVRAVEPFPVRLGALFVDRLAATAFEALVAALGVSLFFVPLVWHGAPRVALLASGLSVVGLLGSAVVGFAIQIYAGDIHVRSMTSNGRTPGDIYGGGGQVLMFSPGVAFAVAAMLILLARLGFGELLAVDGSPRAFWATMAILGISTLVGLGGAMRRFVARFPAMAARFREVDLVGFHVDINYQTSQYDDASRLTQWLPGAVRPVFRALHLQFGRRFVLLRYGYVLFWLVAAVGLTQFGRQAFPAWTVALVPTLATALVINPWFRALRPPLNPGFTETLPLDVSPRAAAATALSLREGLFLAAPYAALVAAVDYDLGWVAALEVSLAVVGPLALGAVSMFVSRDGRLSGEVLLAATCLAAVALTVVAVESLVVALVIAALGAAATVVRLARTRASSSSSNP